MQLKFENEFGNLTWEEGGVEWKWKWKWSFPRIWNASDVDDNSERVIFVVCTARDGFGGMEK